MTRPLSVVMCWCPVFQRTKRRTPTHQNRKLINHLHFHFSPSNCCLTVVSLLKMGTCTKISHTVYCHIKQVFFLTVHVFWSSSLFQMFFHEAAFGGRAMKAKTWSALATGSLLHWPWSPQWRGCSTAWSWWSCCGGRSVMPCCTNHKPPAGDQPGMLHCLLPSGLSAALLAATTTNCILAQTSTVCFLLFPAIHCPYLNMHCTFFVILF